MQPIQEQTLRNIGGQNTREAASSLANTLMQLKELQQRADIENQRVTQDQQDRETLRVQNLEQQNVQLEETDRNIKRQEKEDTRVQQNFKTQQNIDRTNLLGKSSTGLLALISTTPEEQLPDVYDMYYQQVPEEVRSAYPHPATVQSPRQLLDIAKANAASAGTLVDYLATKQKDAAITHNERVYNIMEKPPEKRTTQDTEYLEYWKDRGINYNFSPPTANKTKDSISFLGSKIHPGTEDSVLMSLNTKDRMSFISAHSNLTDFFMETSAKNGTPISRDDAGELAYTKLYTRLSADPGMLNKLPGIGSSISVPYKYTDLEQEQPEPEQEQAPKISGEATLTPVQIEQQLKAMPAGASMSSGGKIYRINPSTGKLQSR